MEGDRFISISSSLPRAFAIDDYNAAVYFLKYSILADSADDELGICRAPAMAQSTSETIRFVYSGGLADNGRLNFYELGRAYYACARVIYTVARFARLEKYF